MSGSGLPTTVPAPGPVVPAGAAPGGAPTSGGHPPHVAGNGGGAGVALMPRHSEWMKAGGDPQAYEARCQLVRNVNDVLISVPDHERAALDAGFMRLPQAAQKAALAVLEDPRHVPPAPVSAAGLQQIVEDPAFAKLAQEWRGDALRRFGKLRARMWWALDRLAPAEAHALMDWFDALPDAAVVALCRSLAR